MKSNRYSSGTIHRWHVYLTLAIMLGLLLAGCGRIDTGDMTVQAAPTTTATAPSAISIPPDLAAAGATADALKQAELDRIQHDIATARSQPTPAIREVLPISTPYVVSSADLGISNNCIGGYRTQLAPRNCWLDIVNGSYVGAISGGSIPEPSQGLIAVYTTTASLVGESPAVFYETPTKAGSVYIKQALNPRLVLVAHDGTTFVFNLTTRAWEDPATLPTATLTALPTALPTSTALPTATSSPTALPTSTPLPTALPSSTPLPTATPAQSAASDTIVVRHAPVLNGMVEGSLRQLLGEAITVNSGGGVTGDLLLPGSPTIRQNGQPALGATVAGSGSAQPSGYQLTLNGGAQIGRLLTRTNPIVMPTVAAPPQPTGTRNVTLNSAGQALGDFATLRNLTLNSNVGVVAVPPGTYGQFTANSGAFLSFGIAGATTPAVYNLQGLTLNGQSALRVVGPVVINLAGGLSINGQLGATDHPAWLVLNVATGAVTVNGGGAFYGAVYAPSSTVTLNSNTQLRGAFVADRLTLNGGATVQGVNAP